MRTICVIPTYNEDETIAEVIGGCKRYCDEILVVDDGSDDETAAEATKAGARLIRHAARLGTGASLSTGFRAALQAGADIVVTVDADGQHSPEDIPRLFETIFLGVTDLVNGSRFLGDVKGMPFLKRLGNSALSIITSILCGRQITDSQSGMRAYTRRVLETITHESAGYSWASEILLLASRNGFRFVEVPIKTIYPKHRRRGTGILDGLFIFYQSLKTRLKATSQQS